METKCLGTKMFYKLFLVGCAKCLKVLMAEQMISLQTERWIALTWPVYALLS